jgi:RNA polymerase sigma-70 factor (ECF subfamily)
MSGALATYTANVVTLSDWLAWLARHEEETLCAVARREGLDAEEARDAVQETFDTLLRLPQAERIVGDACASGRLLRAIVKNRARNRRRRHARAKPHVAQAIEELASHGPSVEELVALAESYRAMHVCMAKLGETQREVIRLRVLEEEPGEIVAELLGTTPGHVAVLLHRARCALRDCMAPY